MPTTRMHIDTLEVRVYGPEAMEDSPEAQPVEDAIAAAFNRALEQVKRDLAKEGLEVEADF